MASTQSPYFISQQQQPPYNSNNTPEDQSIKFNSKVSPSILLIIVILAVIFFVSGLLHLLVRFLLRPGGPASLRRDRRHHDDDDSDSVSALQGQLQQLFHLHDAGVDQSFIDSLPVFQYTSIISGSAAKRPFDCAVCLCEFEPLDKLRLLPKCSHAFHTECIDTWLLSHSTCPLCRASLLFSAATNAAAENCSPIVLVLESGSSNASSTEINTTQEFTQNNVDDQPTSLRDLIISEERESIVTVKLGKFTNLDLGGGGGGGGEASSSASVRLSVSNSVDSRRCFSMGSFAYVMDECSNLRVPIRMPTAKKNSKSVKNALPITRAAMSECDCESRREFEFNANATAATQDLNNSAKISKKESFSISKIWLRSKKEKETNTSVDDSRRAFSFRFQRSVVNNGNNGGVSGEDLKGKNGKYPRRTVSEIGVARWEREGNEMGFEEEEESQSRNSLDSQSNPPSFARKTLLWLMGKQQNKVVHSSFDTNNP